MFRHVLPDIETAQGKGAGGGDICPTLMAGEPEIYVYEGIYTDEGAE